MTVRSYRTLDGSLITELIRPETDGSRNLSVAEAVISPGQSTLAHYHGSSEEVYVVIEGLGQLWIGAVAREIGPGEAHLIPPGEEHKVTCMSEAPLRILCVCSPPYQHADTVISEPVVA